MGMISEFKAFAMRGNVVDMAVGVVIGGAFGKIVSSLVDDLIMPLVGVMTGGVDFTSWKIPLAGDAALGIGNLLQRIVEALGIGRPGDCQPDQQHRYCFHRGLSSLVHGGHDAFSHPTKS